MSVEESEVSTDFRTFLRALANADIKRDQDGEIDWKDFCDFCDQQQISAQFRKSIWKQISGSNCSDDDDDDEKSTILFTNALISNHKSDEDNKHNDAHEADEHDQNASESNELILEFEISDEIIENNDNSPPQSSLATTYHPLKSPHNRLQDISTLFTKYDTYSNDTLIHSEFISMIIELYPAADRNIISDLFTLLDRNDDGTFDYNYKNYMELFQNQLDSYPKNMLSCYEFCNELKRIYCSDMNKDHLSFDSNSTEYDDEDAISTAYTLKKELDYALSCNSNESLNVLRLCCQSLWQWIQIHGIASVHHNITLHKQMNDTTVRNKLLQQEIDEYKEKIRQMNYKLSVSERDRENSNLSLDSLQFELQQMAMQLSQEQNLSDTNSQEIDKLRTSLQRSQNTIKSLQYKQNKTQGNEAHNVWIESGNKIYPQPIDDIEDHAIDYSDECNEYMEVNRFHRDHSYDLPKEEMSNEEDTVYVINDKQHDRKKTIVVTESAALEALNTSLNTNQSSNETMITVQSIHNIQNSLETQQEKLDAIMDVVKRLDIWRDSERINNIKKMKESSDDKKDLSKFRKVIPLLVMGIVCFSGYKAYKYRARR